MTAVSGPAEPTPHDALPTSDSGGDAVCWLERVCDTCGALADGPPQPVCARCGAAQPGD